MSRATEEVTVFWCEDAEGEKLPFEGLSMINARLYAERFKARLFSSYYTLTATDFVADFSEDAAGEDSQSKGVKCQGTK